jgi:hypothetical protein
MMTQSPYEDPCVAELNKIRAAIYLLIAAVWLALGDGPSELLELLGPIAGVVFFYMTAYRIYRFYFRP